MVLTATVMFFKSVKVNVLHRCLQTTKKCSKYVNECSDLQKSYG